MSERPPAVQQLGAAVLLQGEALLVVRRLIELGVKVVETRDGLAPPPTVRQLRRAVGAAAEEYRQQRALPAAVPVEVVTEDRCTTAEAATLLGLSPRQVRRLAERLGATPHGRAWLYERTAVEAYATERGPRVSPGGHADVRQVGDAAA